MYILKLKTQNIAMTGMKKEKHIINGHEKYSSYSYIFTHGTKEKIIHYIL